MKKTKLVLLTVPALIVGGYYLHSVHASEGAAPKHGQVAEAAQEAEAPANSTKIAQATAEQAGIKSEAAASAKVHKTITLTGRITLNQNTTAQVKARFPGIVREVMKGQGETVKEGDALASVESNDSLQRYPVKSPINGVILARNTNIGDVAGEPPLFTIADVSNVWAEFHVFPRDIDEIEPGQIVKITSFEGEHTAEAPIAVVSPIAESSSQTVVARVTLPNAERVWHSGMTVRGDVAVEEKDVPVAVKTDAIQRMEGKAVIFIKNGEQYTMRPVKVGAADAEWTEISEGLKAGENYVSANSFLLKADIGKAGVEED
jgi:cobalt-zinc-cadmium efflux system membrane fusion protein